MTRGSGRLAAEVAGRVSRLQEGYLAQRRTSRSVATLAALRRAAAAPVGSVPQVWEWTVLPWIDDAAGWVGDEPTAEELACHTAMTLYAVHQQSQTAPMHRPARGRGSRGSSGDGGDGSGGDGGSSGGDGSGGGGSLGAAVARLIAAADVPGRRADADRISSLRRRFNALVTAPTYGEVAHHLRGLVAQLRAEGIPLDYGRLADDLARLQDARRADGVRLRWARDLAGTPAADSSTTSTDLEETP